MAEVVIARVQDLKAGTTVAFSFKRGANTHRGFLANFGGKIVAYENLCRHLPLPLDEENSRFFSSDGAHFVCQQHGAIFEPLTGRCVRGPCEGEALVPIPIVIVQGDVLLRSR